MPVQGKPQIPIPYWQMPPPKVPASRPISKQEYCAICELKQLVDKIGQNLCSDSCISCNKEGKGNMRPSTAGSTKQCPPPPRAPCGDSPMVTQQQQHNIIPCVPTQQPKQPSLPCGNPMQTYQWPNYSHGLVCPPQELLADNYYHNRQHPYLPVKIDTLNEDTTKRGTKLHRSKSANVIVKRTPELRSSILVGCECTKKNGLQDTCPRLICKDMPRLGTIDNPSQVPCKDARCKPPRESIVEEDEEECPHKPPTGQCKPADPPKAEIEVPVKTVPECKPECTYPCKDEK